MKKGKLDNLKPFKKGVRVGTGGHRPERNSNKKRLFSSWRVFFFFS